MGDEVDPEPFPILRDLGVRIVGTAAHVVADAVDELPELLGVGFDLRTFAFLVGHLLRHLVVVAEDPHRAGRDTFALGDHVSILVHVDVVVVLPEPDERRFEDVPRHAAVPGLAELRGPRVEAHVRGGGGLLDTPL